MKKIAVITTVGLMSLSLLACSNMSTDQVANTSENAELTTELNASNNEESVVEDDVQRTENNTLEKYIGFVSLSRSEILDSINEEAQVVENDTLMFEKTGIEISFGSIGTSTDVVTKIIFTSKETDFNGAKIGSDVEQFIEIFGEEMRSGEGYKFFQLEDGLILNVIIDTSKGSTGLVEQVELLNPME